MMDDTRAQAPDLVALAGQIVAAFVMNNSARPGEVGALLGTVHKALVAAASGGLVAATAEGEPQLPSAAAIRKSIRPDALISFIDGKPYRALKRHLGMHGLTISSYRERYGLPATYPSVCADYSAIRSAQAKANGLGALRKDRTKG